MRINPDLGYSPPSLDDKSKVRELRHDTSVAMRTDKMQSMTQRIAYQLVASSFYYERTSEPKGDRYTGYSCTGMYHWSLYKGRCSSNHFIGAIRCRFEDESSNLRGLGEFLKHQQSARFQPYFEIYEMEGTSIAEKARTLMKHRLEAL